MKKLGKLKLNNFSEMSEQEMKYIMGGKDYDLCGDRPSDKCSGGVCMQMMGPQTCERQTSSLSGGGNYMTIHFCACVSASGKY